MVKGAPADLGRNPLVWVHVRCRKTTRDALGLLGDSHDIPFLFGKRWGIAFIRTPSSAVQHWQEGAVPHGMFIHSPSKPHIWQPMVVPTGYPLQSCGAIPTAEVASRLIPVAFIRSTAGDCLGSLMRFPFFSALVNSGRVACTAVFVLETIYFILYNFVTGKDVVARGAR
jgi:hypothetical protein